MGAPGRSGVVTEGEGAEGSPVPTALVAVTVKAWAAPFASPKTEAVVPTTAIVAFGTAGEIETAYPVIGLPPVEAGAAHVRVAARTCASARTPVGAPGGAATAMERTAVVLPPGPEAITV